MRASDARSGTSRLLATAGVALVLLVAAGGSSPLTHRTPAATTGVTDPAPLGVDGGSPVALPLPVAEPATGPAPTAPGVRPVRAVRPARPGELDIPGQVLAAYRHATAMLATAVPGCHLTWPVLAGIGRIESDHADLGALRPDGMTVRRIVGPALDGAPGLARIPDTDQGRWDGDRVWDRAVGPMQFIPTTWAVLGRDGNGYHRADPSDIADATLSHGLHAESVAGAISVWKPRSRRDSPTIGARSSVNAITPDQVRTTRTSASSGITRTATATFPARLSQSVE